ncbi:cytolethal distending toxin, subunit C [Campylobacter insulaenigrae]|uniref:cytolethal distending toxin subunit A n=1 Tax=Campylobacter insulaenigrae TaxID=260714 RepID=UPI000F6C3B31|nr:cytolethal distending toxin subunit A [Campylobacter insulaenigrae]MCR6590731.1 cytolethal distending toxin subunit A [Campylobacter insulaenigrae]MCR6592408.1 cytolethal distending toxin subunit A [Campylobacter insulaenigrae]VEJ52677.1 cytolethal distending toxin, subunit C [Campylobacter insulaenigrae]
MKKILLLLAIFINLQAVDPGDLSDFSPPFAIRSLETGITLSPFREVSKDLLDQNWLLREIILSPELKARDLYAERLPFGYVQFVNPLDKDVCLAIDESGFFVGKPCSGDLQSGKLETVFSIMPTTTSAVQIRSLVQGGGECIQTFFNPNVPIEKRFGIRPCILDTALFADVSELMFLSPALVEVTPLGEFQ